MTDERERLLAIGRDAGLVSEAAKAGPSAAIAELLKRGGISPRAFDRRVEDACTEAIVLLIDSVAEPVINDVEMAESESMKDHDANALKDLLVEHCMAQMRAIFNRM